MSDNRAGQLPTLSEQMHKILVKAMAERSKRQEWVDTPDGQELAWVLFERRTMVEAVNALRAPDVAVVTVADVERVEGQAVGHSDYHSKFALYCAELALGLRRTTW